MYATGRKPKTDDISLENTKVECNANGAIIVNDDYQTSEPSIYGLGDVTDRVQLTPVALAEGMALVRNLYGAANQKVDYNFIATAVFSNPNIGTVGYSEEDAVAKYEKIAVSKADFKHMKHNLGG